MRLHRSLRRSLVLPVAVLAVVLAVAGVAGARDRPFVPVSGVRGVTACPDAGPVGCRTWGRREAATLVGRLDRLAHVPQGAYACPSSAPSPVRLVFAYAGHRARSVTVDPAGCRWVVQGSQLRQGTGAVVDDVLAMVRPGP